MSFTVAAQDMVNARADAVGLARLRADAGLTRPQLERALGLPRGVVSHVESGRIYAYPRFRRLVAAFFSARLGESYATVHESLFPGVVVTPPPSPTTIPAEVAAHLAQSGIDPAGVAQAYGAWLESLRSRAVPINDNGPAGNGAVGTTLTARQGGHESS